MTARRVLVTGASGFIGRRVLGDLVGRDFEVHAVARGTPAPEPDSDAVRWHAVDLLDARARRALVDDVCATHLLHLAWYAEPGAFWVARENAAWAAATIDLVDEFAAAGGRRATLAGSCAEYDWDASSPFAETAPLAPGTFYGTCKDATRRVVEELAERLSLSLAWGRIFFVYGPREDERRLVAGVTRALIAGLPAETTPGAQRRDFLHVDDVAAGFAALLDSTVQGPVNVASGEPVTVAEVVTRLAELAGRPDLLRLGALAARAEDPAEISADVTRLRDEVGFRPVRTLARGLEETVGWWRSQEPGEGASAA